RLSSRAVEEYGQGRIRGLVGPARAPGAPVPARWASPAAAIAAVWMAVALGLWVWGVVDGPGRVHTRARGADELVAVASPPDRGVLSLWVRWNARERAPGWVVLESGRRWEAPAELFWRRRVHPGWNLLIWPALPGPGGGLPLTLRVVESEPASWAVTAPHLSAGYGLVHPVPFRGLLAAALPAAGAGAASLVTAIRARRLPRPGWWSLAVGAVALAGLALRLRTLVSHGLWFDEILTAIG